MSKTGYYMPWYTGGSALMLADCALMAAGITVTQALIPVEDLPNAVGLQAIAQVLGSVTFLSVSGNLLFNFAVRYPTPILPPET
ncbi:MFS drug efflux transporter [Colletotrichum plurivorum]|uniref:MFS drug efflux transporter n=1 Tax=Colletotrichum plurivorum TaxID=2175906 RepID=A0A8H6NG71_9PEZI|nr:MFS drug efflux transporter [Colletotrichum plurivorum]